MMLSALQGRTLTRLVEDVRTLLAQGEAPSSSLRALEAVRTTGLWSEPGEVAVVCPALIDQLTPRWGADVTVALDSSDHKEPTR